MNLEALAAKYGKIKITGIYKITSPSGRVYIGQSRNIINRIKKHYAKTSRCFALCASFKKYGVNEHSYEVIQHPPNDISNDVLNTYEILYIGQYKEVGARLLNIKSGGYGGGKSLNKKQPPVKILKPKVYKPLSEEAKLKISKKLKGRTIPAEVRAKISAATKGKQKSEETRLKFSVIHTGKIISENQKEYLRKFNTGKVHSEETKRKMRDAHKGIPKTKEAIAKRTETKRLKKMQDAHK